MEGNGEIASAVNEEPVVELIEDNVELAENGEPIPAGLFAESDDPAACDEPAAPDQPTDPEVIQSLAPESVAEDTDSQPVLEFEADPRAQFQANYRLVAADIVSCSLKGGIAGGLCAFIHRWVTQQPTQLDLTGPVLILIVFVFRLWYVRRGASKLAKTKITLTKDWLSASGPDASKNWKMHISNLDKAALVSEADKRKSLVLTTSNKTRVLRGLESPEKLLHDLPKGIQVETSALEQKLQEFADSMFECKDADEVENLRDAKHLQERVQDSLLQEFPDACVLKQDFSGIANDSIWSLVFLGVIFITAFLGYAQYSLSLLPLLIFAYLPELLFLQRTVDCLYIFSEDALFELDRKRGIGSTITLNRVSIRGGLSKDEDATLYIDNRIRIPARIEKADSEYLRRCLKKYPNSA